MNSQETAWTENVIVADADYLDRVAFNLICNFERMLGRRVPEADLARWAECAALDGGIRQGDGPLTLILTHDANSRRMQNFVPSDYSEQLCGKAFQSPLGEFTIITTDDAGMPQLAGTPQLFADVLDVLLSQTAVKRLIVVPNAEDEATMSAVTSRLRRGSRRDLSATLLTMQPLSSCPCRTEILGYSLMAALGIKAEEIDKQLK